DRSSGDGGTGSWPHPRAGRGAPAAARHARGAGGARANPGTPDLSACDRAVSIKTIAVCSYPSRAIGGFHSASPGRNTACTGIGHRRGVGQSKAMHPKALLDACSELVRLTLQFDRPADAVVSRFFRDHRELGPRERATLAETVYAVLRRKLLFDHFAPSGSGPRERRLAILGFYGPRDFLKSALSEQERNWLDQCDQINVVDLMERHRHNLPEWLVQPLREQLGGEFWPLVDSLNKSAGLDLRVNALTGKRSEVQKELTQAG